MELAESTERIVLLDQVMSNIPAKEVFEMEKMKIDSKIRYVKSRVKNGYGPHRMLEMIQQLKMGRSTDIESKEKDSDSDAAEETILSCRKTTEEKK